MDRDRRQNIQSYESQALAPYQPHTDTIEQIKHVWLNEISTRTHSKRTLQAYETYFDSFRSTVQQFGIDLDGDPKHIRLIAQGWAGQRSPDSHHDGEVAGATYNTRLAAISSFYETARYKELWDGDNPMTRIKRARVQEYANAEAMTHEEIDDALTKIDQHTLPGKRDYALLALAFLTGRRVSEIASLHFGNLTIKPTKKGELIKVHFDRLKGGKTDTNELDLPTSAALLAWLHACYGSELGSLAHNTPLWVSLSRNDTRGQPLSIEALEQIAKRRLGTSKFHTTRHSLAAAMKKAGATDDDIQESLGHESLATTGRYMKHIARERGKYTQKVSALFGIGTHNQDESEGQA